MNRKLYLTLGAMFVFSIAAHTMVPILVPLAAGNMGAPKALIGLVIAAPALISLLTGLPCAVLSDRVGRRSMLIICGLLNVAGAAILATSSNVVGLALGSMLNGLGNSFWWSPVLAYMTEASTPANHAQVQGYNGGVQGLGALLGALVAGAVTDWAGFPAAFALVGALSVLLVVLVVQLEESHKPKAVPTLRDAVFGGYSRAIRLLARRSELRLASLIVLTYAVVTLTLGNSFLPLYMTTELGFSRTLAGSMISTRDLLGMVASALFGLAVARLGFFRLVLMGQALGALSLFAVPFSTRVPVTFLVLASQGIGLGNTPATSNTLVAAGTSLEDRALGFASMGLVSRTCLLILPPLFGALADAAGMRTVFIVGGLMVAANATILAAMVRKHGAALQIEKLLRR